MLANIDLSLAGFLYNWQCQGQRQCDFFHKIKFGGIPWVGCSNVGKSRETKKL